MAYSIPCGNRFASSSILALTLSLSCRAFEPGAWKTASTTVGSSPKKPDDVYVSAPSSRRATSLRRTTEPLGRIGSHDDVAELLRIGEPAQRVDLHLEGRAGRRRRLADLAGRDLDVLLRDGLLHVDGGDAEIGELVRIEPDAHRIAPLAEDLDVADAGCMRFSGSTIWR